MEDIEYTIPDGIYTQKQLNYVDSVKDENLRDHLLHQTRLRDLMEQDRDAFEKDIGNKSSIQHAMKILINSLRTDKDYRRSWQANIAMAFKDEMSNWLTLNKPTFKDEIETELDIHEIANQASNNFLDLLCR